ncbi:MAG: response regulator [Sulfuricurvum sp.]|nr:response regulator [Sulfuricurvum sp.]MDP3023559.1 response regulator [Sulfuricurvum sp.]
MTYKESLNKLIQYGHEIRVLYVEDDNLIRENNKELLTSFFPFVTTAVNGREGLGLYEKESFDLVISDILMPEMNGIQMIEKIKSINPNQSIIVTSACEESSYLLELINLGIGYFILKPIKADQMIDVLLNVTESIFNTKKVEEYNHNVQRDLIHQSSLLEQYKEIVDITSIVSKTDLKGKITYVNDQFCKISGYRREELLNKNHNIVRHMDMSSEVFKEVWKTIKGKQIWQGTIKNKKKNGDAYITQTTIKPILDVNGDIMEYISIRFDVTELYELNEEIWSTQSELLDLVGEIGETRSNETGQHVHRVAEYSKLLGELYGLEEKAITLLYSASPMHDIGKIGIPDSILLKPGKLNEEEFEIMKDHARIGNEIFKKSKRPLMQTASIIAHEHHEKWNGLGYPQGLWGENIHIYGRITALADVFDALNCKRVYKEAWPMEKIIDLIREERGKHFDPKLVDLFIDNVDQFIEISNRFSDLVSNN